MDDKEFGDWCANSGLNEDGIKIIKKIRTSPPVRKVQGNSSNVIGAYPSTKLGFGIQFESHKVEQAFVTEYEFDDDVLEYYDQPGPIHIEYSSKKGRRVAVYSTPDYFVIRRNGIAGWEECKKETDLDAFEKKSNRFERIDGSWRSPCSEEYAGRYGLYFRVRSSAQINWVWQQNIEYLSDYLQKESPRCDDKRALVATTFVMQKQGILLSELLANTEFFSPDDIYALIGQGALYVDIYKEIVSDHDRVHVYSDELHSKLNNQSCLPPQNAFSLEIEPGSTLLWDGRPFTIVNVADNIWIKENDSPPICLTQKELETLVRQNQVKGLKQNTADSFVLRLLQEASPEDYAVANRRLDQIQPYLDNVNIRCKKSRTIRGWIKKYREAENTLGYGYVGLLSKIRDRGNRKPKIPERVRELMVTTIDDLFLTIEQRTLIAVYGEFCIRCEEEGLVPASLRTFSEYRRSLDKVEIENSRKGPRAAYQVGQFYWSLEYTTPRHGVRPFEVAHLDHQEMDIELLHSKTFKNQGRADLTPSLVPVLA